MSFFSSKKASKEQSKLQGLVADLKLQIAQDGDLLLDQQDQATRFRQELVEMNNLYFDTLEENKHLKEEVATLRVALSDALKASGQSEQASLVMRGKKVVPMAEGALRGALQLVDSVLRKGGRRSNARGSQDSNLVEDTWQANPKAASTHSHLTAPCILALLIVAPPSSS